MYNTYEQIWNELFYTSMIYELYYCHIFIFVYFESHISTYLLFIIMYSDIYII